MTDLKSPVDILKLLNKSNCRQCGEKTCMAFAAAVFAGKRRLDECPYIDPEIIARCASAEPAKPAEEDGEAVLSRLKEKVAALDLAAAAKRIGGTFSNGRLTIKVFGKDFHVDRQGNMASDIHINPWVVMPILNYILTCEGIPVSGNWVSFRELVGGQPRQGLFLQRCEKPMKKIADSYTEFFEDLIHIFNGRKVEDHYESDISLVLHPLPKIPILICYWKPEEGLESDLKLFFDSTADKNMAIEHIYTLVAGLVRMFEKLALRHATS
ncbi:MAG: DUF3786 domain-containing protein [Desulfobacterales bacterium]